MSHVSQISRIVGQFVRDDRGSITLEFVLWLPFLLFWLVFSLGAFLAMDNRYDAANGTYLISDIISRYQEPLSRDSVEDLRLLREQLVPNAANGLMRISSISFDSGAYTVDWTACFGGIPPLTDEAIPLDVVPTNMGDGRSVILTETFTPYFPISDYWLPSSLAWQIGIVVRPRFVTDIEPGPELANTDNDCIFADDTS